MSAGNENALSWLNEEGGEGDAPGYGDHLVITGYPRVPPGPGRAPSSHGCGVLIFEIF